MEGHLQEIFNLIEQTRDSEVTKRREKAQEEYFKLKDKLGLRERSSCGNIDQLFSFIENKLYNEARTLLQKARGEYNQYLLPMKPPVLVQQKLDTYSLKQFRKEVAGYAVERLTKAFLDTTVRPMIRASGVKPSKPVQTYAEKSVEIIWWMCVQNPPVYMHKGEKEAIDHSLYKPYTRSGQVAEFYVWPALLLHENGPVLSKGIVQAK